jgi:hypothetical protein
MADFAIKKRDAKTGNKKERVVAKLSSDQIKGGKWIRGAGGAAYHFFIADTSVCGRSLVFTNLREGPVRRLCPDCYAAVNRATNAVEMFGGS